MEFSVDVSPGNPRDLERVRSRTSMAFWLPLVKQPRSFAVLANDESHILRPGDALVSPVRPFRQIKTEFQRGNRAPTSTATGRNVQMQIVKAGARLLASRKRRLDHEHHTKDDNQCEDDDGKQARGSDRGARLQRTLLCWVRTMKDLVTITA